MRQAQYDLGRRTACLHAFHVSLFLFIFIVSINFPPLCTVKAKVKAKARPKKAILFIVVVVSGVSAVFVSKAAIRLGGANRLAGD